MIENKLNEIDDRLEELIEQSRSSNLLYAYADVTTYLIQARNSIIDAKVYIKEKTKGLKGELKR